MEIAGWAVVAVGVVTSAVFALGHALDQIPVVAVKVIKAVRAVRSVRAEFRGSATPPNDSATPAGELPPKAYEMGSDATSRDER
jgi:hypothetical protein